MNVFAELDATLKVVNVLESSLSEAELKASFPNKTLVSSPNGTPVKGGSYDPELYAFFPIKQFDSYVKNTETYEYDPPIPGDRLTQWWDESIQSWRSIADNSVVSTYTVPEEHTIQSLATRLAALEADEISDDATS